MAREKIDRGQIELLPADHGRLKSPRYAGEQLDSPCLRHQ